MKERRKRAIGAAGLIAASLSTACIRFVIARPAEELAHVQLIEGEPDVPYEKLGYVSIPSPERLTVAVEDCREDGPIQELAIALYGEEVDAIIRFHRWQRGRTWRCDGVAVRLR